LSPVLEGRQKACVRTKYVKGGSTGANLGTKQDPFTSLLDAQNDEANWDVLVVLASSVALDGGITLLNGRTLRGDINPTKSAQSPVLPTITNTSIATLGGTGVLVDTGASVTIENIYFKDTQSSAINYDAAVDLTVKHVLITGHNQAGVLLPAGNFGAAGISGVMTLSGKTYLEDIVIRDNVQGAGVLELLTQKGIERSFEVAGCECARLTSDSGAQDVNSGIFIQAFNGTISRVALKDLYIHDLFGGIFNIGVNCWAFEGAQQAITIDGATFSHLDEVYFDIQVVSQNSTVPSPLALSKLTIKNCIFDGLLNSNDSSVNVFFTSENADGELVVKDCAFTNPVCNVLVQLGTAGKQKVNIENTTTVGGREFPGTFFRTTTFDAGAPSLLTNPERITHIRLTHNTYVGGSPITVAANLDGSNNPWTHLKICAEHNCFTAQVPNTVGILSSSGNPGASAGDATIEGAQNSFVGYNHAIQDDAIANVNYDLPKNFWGAGTVPCGICPASQSCVGAFCFGPITALADGYAGTIDVSNPRICRVKCPQNCKK
jgi:hypothetical protein